MAKGTGGPVSGRNLHLDSSLCDAPFLGGTEGRLDFVQRPLGGKRGVEANARRRSTTGGHGTRRTTCHKSVHFKALSL